MTLRISLIVTIALAGIAPAADPSSLELVKSITLKGKAGKLDHLALDARRDRLFLADTANGTLDVIDVKAGKLLKQITGQSGIQGVAYAADLDRVFVGLGTGGYCNVFDGADYKPLKTIKFADDADNVKYDRDRSLTFVAHAEKSLGVIDAKTFAIKADIKLPGPAEGFQVATGKPLLFLVSPSPSQLIVIDPDKKEVVRTHPINMASGGHPLALDNENRRVFIGCRSPAAVVVMDQESGKELTSVPIPKDIDDLFYDAKRQRLYASCGEGFIAVVRQKGADSYEVVEKVPTVKNAKTAFFDAESGRLFLAVPRQEGKPGPEIHVYRVKD